MIASMQRNQPFAVLVKREVLYPVRKWSWKCSLMEYRAWIWVCRVVLLCKVPGSDLLSCSRVVMREMRRTFVRSSGVKRNSVFSLQPFVGGVLM